jgi:two-component sensor histidine kinase
MPKPLLQRTLSLPLLRRWPVAGYGVALAAFAVAFVLRRSLDPVLPSGFPFLTFFPAVVVGSLAGGTVPGLVVSVLSLASAWFFFMPTAQATGLDAQNILALSLFAFVALVDVLLIHVVAGALDHLRSERALSLSLADTRESLFRELQHRISNNLQLVSGLMRMQRGRVADPEARKVLDEAANRLVLIGKLHRHLNDPAGSPVGFDVFLRTLCADIVESSGTRNVACHVRADPVSLGPDRTIPLALVVSELVGNAIAHGMEGRASGTIAVTLDVQADGWLALAVSDDGPGLPPGFDLAKGGSLGLRVVRALATQVGGEFALFNRDGAVGRLAFPA